MSHGQLKPVRPNWLYGLALTLFLFVFGTLGWVFGPLFTPGDSSYGEPVALDDSKRWAGYGVVIAVVLFAVFRYVVSKSTRPDPGPSGLPIEPNPDDYMP